MKLGNCELEPMGSTVSASTLNARVIFMELVGNINRDTVADLLRICNFNEFPIEWRMAENKQLGINVFLFQLKNPELLDLDLSDIGFSSSLRDTPIVHFCRFLRENGAILNDQVAKSREEGATQSPNPEEHLIQRTALDRLVPNWAKLEEYDNSEDLRRSLLAWADNSHLKDEWCLDFAINALKAFKFECIDQNQLDRKQLLDATLVWMYEWHISDWTWKAWSEAIYEFNHERFQALFRALVSQPESKRFTYKWRGAVAKDKPPFEIDDYFAPYTMTETDLVERVERKFWETFFLCFGKWPGELVGQTEKVLDNIKRFRVKLQEYTKECIERQKGFGTPVVKKSTGDKHFRWLAEYQLSGSGYQSIASREGVARSTVIDGVKDASRIVGLTLRKPKKTGRPRGVRELHKRLILGR